MFLKKITQSITTILVVTLTIAIPIAMALIMKFLTITAWIDYLFRVNLILFWVVMVISRLGFACLWGLIDAVVVCELDKRGWFWFAPDRYYGKDKPGKDYSFVIVLLVAAAVFAFIVTEAIIHLFTPETPPFWFWK